VGRDPGEKIGKFGQEYPSRAMKYRKGPGGKSSSTKEKKNKWQWGERDPMTDKEASVGGQGTGQSELEGKKGPERRLTHSLKGKGVNRRKKVFLRKGKGKEKKKGDDVIWQNKKWSKILK